MKKVFQFFQKIDFYDEIFEQKVGRCHKKKLLRKG